MEISVVIVSWNVCALLRRAIASVLADASIEYDGGELQTEIIVVDNASQDGTIEMLRAEFPQVLVIANTSNAGFTRGNNQALQVAQGRYLFLLNPDTEIERGTLRALVNYMEASENARVGIIGPQLVYGDGSPQSSRRRFPTFTTALLESTKLQEWFPNNKTLARYYLSETPDDAVQDVDWVVGAAMFVRRAVYNEIGGLDERFFMYSEELDWCLRAKKAGWRVVYFPTVRVLHYEGKSSEQAVAQRDIYFHSSKVRYFAKHHSVLQGELLRYFLLGTFVYRTLEECTKYLLGHKRELRAQRISAHINVLKSGLR